MLIQQDPGGDFLNAFLAAYGMSNQAQQQKIDRKRQAQIDAQNAALNQQSLQLGQQALTKGAQEQRDYQANQGVDPTTGKPFVMPQALTQVRPNNKGKGGAPSADEEIAHLTALLSYYTKTKQKDLADVTATRLSQLEVEKRREESEAASLQKGILLNQMTTQRDQSLLGTRDADTLSRMLELFGLGTGRAFGLESMRENASGSKAAQAQANKATTAVDSMVTTGLAAMTKQNDAAAAAGKDPQNPNMATFADGLRQRIAAVRKNPALADATIKAIMAAPMSDSQKTLAVQAIGAAAKAAAMQSMAARSGGGSNAGSDPQYPGP